MAEAAFSDISVVDASDHIAGQFATRVLADFGADVVLAERRGGSILRSAPPLAGDRSLLFEHLNGGKRSTPVSNLDGLAQLARGADVVVVSDREVADELLRREVPAIVVTVTEFSSGGPYASWRGSELIHQALSGSMFYTGLADREPLFGVGHRSYYAAGMQLFIGIVAALYQRAVKGESPRRIAVSVHEAAAAMEQNFSTQFAYNGTFPQRGERTRPKGHARCRDGWVVYFARFGQWADFCAAFGADELADDARFATWSGLVGNWSAAVEELQSRAVERTTAEVFAVARDRKLVLAPMVSLRALIDEPHLRGREFWSEVDGPVGLALGPLFRTSLSSWDRTRPAPDPSGQEASLRAEHSSVRPTNARPLEGVRVLDVTSAWAGPMATRLLASLGADVLKLEGPGRPDSWRGETENPPRTYPYPDGAGGDRPYDRHCWFNSQNQDKRSVTLDIKRPEGLALARQLAEKCDVIVANWSPGALDRSGLGHGDAVAINPEIVVVEMPAISSTGPLADVRGLGPTMEAMSGIAALIGYPDDRPTGSGSAYLDPTGGLHGAAAALTALYHRARSGCGQRVEVAQREAAMHWIGELVLDEWCNSSGRRAAGNRSAESVPHGAYPTSDDDEWIAIDVRTDDEWQAVCDVLAVDVVDRQRWSEAERRRDERSDVDATVASCVAGADRFELAERLQRAGVRAASVQNGRDLFEDPHLRARGWFTRLDHEHAGTHEYPGLPLEFDGERFSPSAAAPWFGQHAQEVLVELAGVDDETFRQLVDAGVTADEPRSRDAR